MKNICFIVSNIDKALAFEWLALYFKDKCKLHFILLNPNPSKLQFFLEDNKVPYLFVKYNGKKDIPLAVLKVMFYLLKNNIKIVHTHLFDANLIGLFAAKILFIPKRIFTRHHATYHHEYFPKAVRYDKWINGLSTHIVAISENVRKVLIEKEGLNASKITLVHHGFDLQSFENGLRKEILMDKYNLNRKKPVIGVISRYLELKGIQFIIPAFKKVLEKYPDALLILANAKGDYSKQIKNLLSDLPNQSYVEIEFEENIQALYHLFDVFIHVPINLEVEAYGQTYVEALAAKIPSVFSMSGIAPEFIQDKYNALVVDYKNSEQIFTAITEILENQDQKELLIKNGVQSVKTIFSLEIMMNKLSNLYFN